MAKIRKRFRDLGVNNREDCKRLVAEDWKESLNVRAEGAAGEEENITNVQFKFCFNKSAIQSDIRLPLEYETNIASFMEKIECQPVINFDDLEPFEPIELLDFEVERYKPFGLPPMSQYDPVFQEKKLRPGCEYESTIRQLAGEPDLEKTQMAAHEQMELLKSAQKEIVSAANVAAPASFVKPLDYSVDLLVRTHPTLREYCREVACVEVEPESALYPLQKERVMPKDEVELKNAKSDADASFVKTLSKSISGAFINTNDVPTYDLPGNFGVRVIETMPTDMRNVHIDQMNNLTLGFNCDSRPAYVPGLLEKPDNNDYLTDEESDDAADFEVKVPELGQLLN